MPNHTRHQPATTPADPGRVFAGRASAGDVTGHARLRTWLWVIDRPNITA